MNMHIFAKLNRVEKGIYVNQVLLIKKLRVLCYGIQVMENVGFPLYYIT